MKKILMALAVVTLMLTSMAVAQTVPPATYQWTAPTTGSVVVKYIVELSTNGGSWVLAGETVTTEYTFLDVMQYDVTYEVRVAGVDAADRQGPYSLSSDPYTPDAGAPGVPGTPIILGL